MRTIIRHEPDMRGIFRLYDANRDGYFQHVTLLRKGKVFRKSFYEKHFGGEQATLKLAQAWRDAIIAEHPAMSLAQYCGIVRKNNTSGAPGVSRIVRKIRRKNGSESTFKFWLACIPQIDGRSRTRCFSISVYGEDGARQLAIEARQQGLNELGSLVFQETQQPQPVSTEDDMALLQATLRAPEEQRKRLAAEKQTRQEKIVQRVADKLAQAEAAEKAALSNATNRSGEPYIGRFMNSSGGTYYWRVSISRQSVRHRKSFSDSTYGGAAAALLAAKAWRDQMFSTLPMVSKAQRVAHVNSTNTSGIAGVGRVSDLRNGVMSSIWVAHCPKVKGQRRRSRTFSIAKYSEEQAFALAVQARAAFVAEFTEETYLSHPSAKQMRRALDMASTDDNLNKT
jgi:hypothetical protein